MSRKIIFANRYYFPDISATSQMLTDIAGRLADAGFDVHVVCSRQLYEDPTADLPVREQVGRVEVHRVWSSRFGRDNLGGRLVDYASFYLTCIAKLLKLARKGDVLVVKTDPPLLSIPGALVAALRSALLVNWLQDVFPEAAARLAALPLPRWAESGLKALRDRSLACARANIVLGSRMEEYLLARGIRRERLRIIENWADSTVLRPRSQEESELRQRLNLQDHFVVAYSGNLGRAHEFQTLLSAAGRLIADPAFVFLMIGGGAGMRVLCEQVEEGGLDNFRFLPYQPREELADSLAAADVHLACLLPHLEGLIVPSKIYGILAAGRPTVFVGDADGEVPRMLRAAQCGLTVSCGDGTQLARELKALRLDAKRVDLMGRRARQLFESRHTLNRAVDQWIRLLAELGLQAARPSDVSVSSTDARAGLAH